jgi:hypothetical protein
VAGEQAINLAVMALYTAKNQGRNRAVDIVAAQAQSAPELRRVRGPRHAEVAPGPLALAA